MKLFFLLAIMTVFMPAFILSGCSQPAAKNPGADGNAGAVSGAEGNAALQADTAGVSGWAVVLNFSISHATNICGFLNKDFGITAGYAGEAHYTNDGAKAWPQAQNTSMCLFGLDIVDGNIAWVCGNGNNVRMSSDGGKTWTEKSNAELGPPLSYIDFVDGKNGWVANLTKLAATGDGAQTWKEIALPENAESIAAICLRTPECGYLMTHGGLLFTTADGGATWSENDLDLKNYNVADTHGNMGLNQKSIALADLSFTDENNGTIVFAGMVPGQGFITLCLKTSDGGATWESLPIPDLGFAPKKVFLSGDGKCLTLCTDDNKTAVLTIQ